MFKILFCFLTVLCFLEVETLQAKCILVVGGAGYIGSHVNERLHENGYETIVLDNLIRGNKKAVQHGKFIEGDINDSALLDEIFSTYTIDAVMHFAAFLEVVESMEEPLKYYHNNVAGTISLLDAMQRHAKRVLIFSSSCTIFGNPGVTYISETTPCNPISPYGASKLMFEAILKDLDRVNKLKYCSLRYFNAAGGDPKGNLKNYKNRDSTLIPIILRGLKQPGSTFIIYGTDYPTPDGTCIRDYIHIEDIARAHIAAMEKLFSGADSACYNLGNKKGYSVKEVISAIEKVTNMHVNVKEGPRRNGDPPILIADSAKAQEELKWIPQYSLEEMIEDAWRALENN